MTTRHTSGFSLIEVILVLALVGVVALFSMGLSLSSISRSAVAQERDLFVSLLLRGARAAALANINEQSHGVKIDNVSKQYTLFEGVTFDPDAGTNRVIPFTSDTIAVTDTTIVFEQRSGDVSAGAGTITFGSGDQSRNIVINQVGQIDW